jgi:hypothetical protein
MNPPTHFGVNLIIAVPLKYVFGWDSSLLIIFISAGVLIDFDHIFFLIIEYPKANIKAWVSKALEMRARMQANLYIFHSPEFNLLLLILSFFNHICLAIFLSNLIHTSLDAIEHYHYHKNFSWFKRWSIIQAFR